MASGAPYGTSEQGGFNNQMKKPNNQILGSSIAPFGTDNNEYLKSGEKRVTKMSSLS